VTANAHAIENAIVAIRGRLICRHFPGVFDLSPLELPLAVKVVVEVTFHNAIAVPELLLESWRIVTFSLPPGSPLSSMLTTRPQCP
jgi:hypothetical protein